MDLVILLLFCSWIFRSLDSLYKKNVLTKSIVGYYYFSIPAFPQPIDTCSFWSFACNLAPTIGFFRMFGVKDPAKFEWPSRRWKRHCRAYQNAFFRFPFRSELHPTWTCWQNLTLWLFPLLHSKWQPIKKNK